MEDTAVEHTEEILVSLDRVRHTTTNQTFISETIALVAIILITHFFRKVRKEKKNER